HQACDGDAAVRERQGAQGEGENDRRAERSTADDGRASRQRANLQPTLDPGDVGVELVSRAHHASQVKIPRVACPGTGSPPTTRPAPPSAPPALCTTIC